LGELSEEDKLKPLTDIGTGDAYQPQVMQLSEIISKMNDLFEGDLSEADYIGFTTYISEKMLESDILAQQAAANSKQQFAASPDFKNAMLNAAIEGIDNHQAMVKQMLGNERIQGKVADILAELVYKRFTEKQVKEKPAA
jgi:type I restriction enzyme R subunit